MVESVKVRLRRLERQVKELNDLKRLVLSKGRVGGKVEFIMEWMEELLNEEGEVTVVEAKGWAVENGVSWTLMNRAKERLGLGSFRVGKFSTWKKG